MNIDYKTILYGILLWNGMISLVYTLVVWIRVKKPVVLFRGLTMFLCPVVGPVCYFSCFIFKWILKDETVDYSKLSFDKSKREFFEWVDKEQEMEVLPFEEVLTVSAEKDRRKAMLNILKMDVQENLALVRKAVENEDSETSHYAASVLAEVMSQFQLQLKDLQAKFDKDRTNKDVNIEFLEAVMRILNTGGLIGVEKMKYEYTFINLLRNLDSNYPDEVTEDYFAMMVRTLYEVGQMKEAEEWAHRSVERQPEAEQSYLNVMYIQYMLGKQEEFEQTLDRLRHLNIDLSRRGLDIVRFWIAR